MPAGEYALYPAKDAGFTPQMGIRTVGIEAQQIFSWQRQESHGGPWARGYLPDFRPFGVVRRDVAELRERGFFVLRYFDSQI